LLPFSSIQFSWGPSSSHCFSLCLFSFLFHWSGQGYLCPAYPYVYTNIFVCGLLIILLVENRGSNWNWSVCTRLHSATFQKTAIFVLLCTSSMKPNLNYIYASCWMGAWCIASWELWGLYILSSVTNICLLNTCM
jgi:hypothetical protein